MNDERRPQWQNPKNQSSKESITPEKAREVLQDSIGPAFTEAPSVAERSRYERSRVNYRTVFHRDLSAMEAANTAPAPEVPLPKENPPKILTLPTDSAKRKNHPVLSGCLKYFPAAIAGVAQISKLGNDKHNPGEPLHHARGKSMDHGDCIVRHLLDTEDLLAAITRGEAVSPETVLQEANSLAWRALAYSQMLHEQYGAPLAPGAK